MARVFAIVPAILSLAVSLHAQDVPVARGVLPHKAAPVATGTIGGTVYCADTRRPARGATILLFSAGSGPEQKMGHTGFDGSFVLSHVPIGNYAVLAFFPGYSSPAADEALADMGDSSAGREFEKLKTLATTVVQANQTTKVDVSLVRGAAVSGRVLYSDGSPAAIVSIIVEEIHQKPKTIKTLEDSIDKSTIFRNLFSHQSLTTDDQGRFRIAGITAGSYRVAAVASGANSGSNTGNEAMMASVLGINTDLTSVRVYSGDTLHASTAKQYDLRPGDEVSDITITLPLEAFHRVGGTLQSSDGRPINTGHLTLTDTTDESFAFHTDVHGDGTFTFYAVPAGTYTLSATSATIGVPMVGNEFVDIAEGGMPLNPKYYFANGTSSLIVKDADLSDALLSLKEVPAPKEPNGQSMPTSVLNDDER